MKIQKQFTLLALMCAIVLPSCSGNGGTDSQQTSNSGGSEISEVPGSSSSEETSNPMPGSRFSQVADYSDRHGVKRDWDKVSSYLINYGPFQEEMLKYDVCILGSGMQNADGSYSGVSPEDVKKLHDAGVWALAYTTWGEDYSLKIGDGLGPDGYASWYLYDESGQPIPNGDWGSYYTNPAAPGWQEYLINDIQRIVDMGYDGILMDTIDSVYVYPETLSPMVQLIHKVRLKFPNLKMVLNRGFKIIPTAYHDLDGNLFELFSTAYDTTHFVYDKLDFEKSVTFTYNRIEAVRTINACRQDKYFPVFAMEYYPSNEEGGNDLDRQAIYNNDWLYDFIPYINEAGRSIGGHIQPYTFRPTNQTMRGAKALLEKDASSLPKNGDTSDKNLVYAENGATVVTDSNFNGYSAVVLNDGYISNEENFADLGWAYANWASAETDVEHWVEFTLPVVKNVDKVVIWWAYDNGEIYSSRYVTVQIYKSGQWVEVGREDDISNNTTKSEITLTNAKNVKRIRIHQDAGKGPKTGGRDKLMWVSEVEMY